MEILAVLLVFALLIGVPVAVVSGFVAMIVYWLRLLHSEGRKYQTLVQSGQPITATVSSVTDAMPGNDLTMAASRRYVRYRFDIDGVRYQGETADRSLLIGDEIAVAYDPTNPADNARLDVVQKAVARAPVGMPVSEAIKTA